MSLDCLLIGFHDEPMTEIIKRVQPYRTQNAGYNHMLARSAVIKNRRMKYSEILKESISASIGFESDLTNFRMPSMPVHYLAHYLKKRGLNVEFINFYNAGKEHLEYILKNNPPRCVGISSTCQVEPKPLRIVVDHIRKINPDPVIVIGGPYINSINFELRTDQQDYILKMMGADLFVHERQGEKTLYNICLELRKSHPDFSTIPNLIYYKDQEFRRTEKIPENIDLNADPEVEFTFYEDHPRPPVYIRTAISCPQNCAFCRYPLLGGDHVYMYISSIEKNMNYIHSLGVRTIVFIDDSVNIPLDRFKEMLRMMIRNKYHFKWFSFFRISHSDEEAYDLMAESGCSGVLLGIESGDRTILKNMNKQVTPEKYKWGINQLNQRNIISHASCMIGFPGETIATAQKTLHFIDEVKPTFYDLQTWFFEEAVPIAFEKEYYKLTGYGYSWKHKDMDWQVAANLVIEGIRNIKNSYFLPSLSFNLWSLAYYFTQGATLDEFKTFSGIFKYIIGKESHEIDDDYKRNEEKILDVFRNNNELYKNLKSRNAGILKKEDNKRAVPIH